MEYSTTSNTVHGKWAFLSQFFVILELRKCAKGLVAQLASPSVSNGNSPYYKCPLAIITIELSKRTQKMFYSPSLSLREGKFKRQGCQGEDINFLE